MITYVVCVYRPQLYQRVCRPMLEVQRDEYGASIVEVSHPTSIFAAYENGRQLRQVGQPICYLHDDLELLDHDATPRICKALEDADLVGLAGAGSGMRLPWWSNPNQVGGWVSYSDMRDEQMWNDGNQQQPLGNQRPGLHPATLLDGILLAESVAMSQIPWPASLEGWHGYDAERCLMAHYKGLKVGTADVRACHHSQPHDEQWTRAHKPALDVIRERWGLCA